jgi:hypothetical protein
MGEIDELRQILNEDRDEMGRIRGLVDDYARDSEGYGAALDHVLNTLDTVVLPSQRTIEQAIADIHKWREKQERISDQAVKFMSERRGMWVMVQRIGVVIAALSSLAALILKLKGV